MKIWIDGDACPKVIKDILFRAAIRSKTTVIIVANHFISVPASPWIQRWIVSAGLDAADTKIIDNLGAGDLVITADIPFADLAIAKKAMALNPRGELYSADNIKQILGMRNFNESLRSSGLLTGGAAKISAREIQNFSNNLDRIITKYSIKET